MKEKLLGSVVVSHYGPFEKGEAKVFAAERMKDDSVLEVCHGESIDGDGICTVFSRNGDDLYLRSIHLRTILRST